MTKWMPAMSLARMPAPSIFPDMRHQTKTDVGYSVGLADLDLLKHRANRWRLFLVALDRDQFFSVDETNVVNKAPSEAL